MTWPSVPSREAGNRRSEKMARKVKLFALSTCGHCRNTRRWLDEHKIPYECIEVDLQHGEDKRKVIDEMKRWNPNLTFPTMILDGGKETIVGFHPEKFEEAFKGG
jgi:glutaredoxin-like protein NrdH